MARGSGLGSGFASVGPPTVSQAQSLRIGIDGQPKSGELTIILATTAYAREWATILHDTSRYPF